MTPRPRASPAAVLAMAALSIHIAAQTPAPGASRQESTPTFRSGVKLIDLDVFVTDPDGHFVKDLTRDDFEVVEDGKPQDIRAFSLVDLPFERSQPVVAETPAPEPDVVSNNGPQGRLYVLLLDTPSTTMPPRFCIDGYPLLVRRLANSFVDEFLQPGDLMAVVHAQGTFTDAQPLTASQSLLHRSIDRYGMGVASVDRDSLDKLTGEERIQRALQTYRTISDLTERLGAVTGRRKTVLWLGGQMLFDPSIDGLKTAGDFAPVLAAHRDTVALAARNNVAVDAIDPCGLTTELGRVEMDRRSGLQLVAEDTNGRWIVGTNNFRDAFTDVVRDNSTYYVLGYMPANDYRDGKCHDVTVRIKRAGRYTVRSRKCYMAPAPDTRARDGDQAAPPPGASVAARDALRMPIPVRGLELSLFNAAFKGEAKEDSVIVGGTVSGELLAEGSQEIGLSYQVFTTENHVQVGEYKTFTLSLQPDSRANVAANGLHFVERLSLPPGRYEIRYAVDQPGGHVGSVVAPVIVPKFDDALSLSGVVLASDRTATHFMLRDDAAIRERLGANPTSVRAFHRGDNLNAFAEIYSDDTRLTADDLTVTGSLTTSAGKAVAKNDARLRSAVQPGDGRWAYSVDVDLADVPPGSYVLTVEATSTRHKEPVRHAVPITVEE